MIRAVIFDFDGLIVDSEVPVFKAWEEVYAAHGQSLDPGFWAGIIGRASNFFDPVADLERRLGRPLDAAAIRAERRARELELMAGQPVRPGVREWTKAARAVGMGLAVASSSTRAWVTGNLERLGLTGWDCVCCRDDGWRAKPEPDLYLAALDCLGVGPAEAIAVEDSHHGVAAARAAGIYCVAVPGAMTSGHDFDAADLVLGSLLDRTLAEVAAAAARADGVDG